MEMAAHLVTLLSSLCTDPIGPTTMPPNAFIALISDSKSNPSCLPCTTSTLILAELPLSMDMVTTQTMQHGWDMPLIVMMSTLDFFQDQHWSANNPYQLVLNTASHQHRCLPPGVPHLYLWWERRLVLMPCPLDCFWNSPRPSAKPCCIDSNVSCTFNSPFLSDLCCSILHCTGVGPGRNSGTTAFWLWSPVIVSSLAIRSSLVKISMFGTCQSLMEIVSGNPVTKISLVKLSSPTSLNTVNLTNCLILQT